LKNGGITDRCGTLDGGALEMKVKERHIRRFGAKNEIMALVCGCIDRAEYGEKLIDALVLTYHREINT